MIKIDEIFQLLRKIKKVKIKILNSKKKIHEPKVNISRIKKEFNFLEKNSFKKNFYILIKKYIK